MRYINIFSPKEDNRSCIRFYDKNLNRNMTHNKIASLTAKTIIYLLKHDFVIRSILLPLYYESTDLYYRIQEIDNDKYRWGNNAKLTEDNLTNIIRCEIEFNHQQNLKPDPEYHDLSDYSMLYYKDVVISCGKCIPIKCITNDDYCDNIEIEEVSKYYGFEIYLKYDSFVQIEKGNFDDVIKQQVKLKRKDIQ